MFVASEADADATRGVFEQDAELLAAVELRRRFPGISDNEGASVPPVDRRLAAAREVASDRDAYPPEREYALKASSAGLGSVITVDAVCRLAGAFATQDRC